MVISKRLDSETEDFERWQMRAKAYKEWKAKHSVKECKVGDKIDVRDTQSMWCAANIELKISSEKRQPILYIHYEVL